jgi:hypothetical protein
VVDFARERVIDVDGVAEMCRVSDVTVRRWFKRGLEWCKLGGKVFTSLEALNRFQKDGQSNPMIQAVIVDSETLAALRSLRKKGFSIGSEAGANGSKAQTAVG